MWRRLFAAAFFLFVLIPVSAQGATLAEIDSQIAKEERQRKNLEQQLKEYLDKIKNIDRRRQSLLTQLDQHQQDTKRAEQEIVLIKLQIDRLQKSISMLSAEMGNTRKQIDQLALSLSARLLDLAKYGSSEELNLVLSSESPQEVLESIHLLERLARHDSFILEQLHSKRQEIALSQQTLEGHRDRLKDQMQSLNVQKRKYDSSIQRTNNFLEDMRREKNKAQNAAKEMEDAQKAVGQTILTLMRQKKEAEEKKTGSRRGATKNYLEGRGRGSMFDWPVRGRISSPFGTRVHPVFRTKAFHSGLDIASPNGTPVKAGAPGEVLFSGWMRGYGQIVILDHGKDKQGRDISTVYAHMSRTQVKEGDIVKPNGIVGNVGNTGTSTGYHLHFEVRISGKAQEPLNYLKR